MEERKVCAVVHYHEFGATIYTIEGKYQIDEYDEKYDSLQNALEAFTRRVNKEKIK